MIEPKFIQNCKPGTHTLKAKVDIGTEGNTLPLWTLYRMFQNKVNSLGQLFPDTMQKVLTVLTAYNGSNIMQNGLVCIQK